MSQLKCQIKRSYQQFMYYFWNCLLRTNILVSQNLGDNFPGHNAAWLVCAAGHTGTFLSFSSKLNQLLKTELPEHNMLTKKLCEES